MHEDVRGNSPTPVRRNGYAWTLGYGGLLRGRRVLSAHPQAFRMLLFNAGPRRYNVRRGPTREIIAELVLELSDRTETQKVQTQSYSDFTVVLRESRTYYRHNARKIALTTDSVVRCVTKPFREEISDV